MAKCLLITLVCIVAIATVSSATIINVPGQQPTIQAGINASANGDTVLVQPGTYVENINFNDHSIKLSSLFLTTGDTSYISTTIIDGDSSGSVIAIDHTEDSTTAIIGLTIQNGYSTDGGGINFQAFGITLSNLIIKNNSTSDSGGIGGGVYVYPLFASQNINISNCTFIENYSYYGGALAFQRVRNGATIDNCYFSGNMTPVGGNGGAITFYDETGQENTNCTISNCIITNNLSWDGGAINIGIGRNIRIEDCQVTNNNGTNASSIYISEDQNDSLIISNCTFTNNHSYGNLGTIRLTANCIVRNSIISDNTSDGTNGGIAFFGGSVEYSNVYENYPSDFIGSVPPGLGELDDINANGDSCDIYNNIELDPLFCDPTNDDYQLAETSPCLGAGEGTANIGVHGIGCMAVDVDEEFSDVLPSQFNLLQNYPNPFNPATLIEYSLPRRSHVLIEIFNVLGQKVQRLVDRQESAGNHSITWDGRSDIGQPVATGLYLYRFQAGEFVQTKKMLMLK